MRAHALVCLCVRACSVAIAFPSASASLACVSVCVCVCARACANGGDRIAIICGFLILTIDVVSPLPVAGTVATTTPTTTVTTAATSGEKVYGCMRAWDMGVARKTI